MQLLKTTCILIIGFNLYTVSLNIFTLSIIHNCRLVKSINFYDNYLKVTYKDWLSFSGSVIFYTLVMYQN